MKYLTIALVSLFFQPLLAKEDLSKLNPLSGRGFFKIEKLQPGQLSDLQIELQLQEGFWAYHDRFNLKVINPENAEVGELFIDPIIQFDDTVSKKKKKGINKSATITTQIAIPDSISADMDHFDMELTYIACTKKFCLTPRKLNFQVDVDLPATVNSEKKDISSSAYIQEQIDQNLAYALVLIFLFGLLTSLTPCVYPLIPITMAVLGTNENRSQAKSFAISLSYVLGIGITYALLGVVAAQTGQLFGSLISHPAVIITMSLLFFLMGLSLLGLFELQAPAFIRNRMSNTQTQKGYVGAFASGLVAGIVASPCVGPVLVGVLAYIAKTQNSALGFMLLFTFAMGFGMLFILLGTFSQLANRLPRSGAWMNTVKTVLALCLFGLSIWYAWPLAKPYLNQSSVVASKKGPQWQKFSEDLIAKAKADGKPVIIDFFADWCVACGELDEFTFSKPKIVEKSKEFVMLKVDATSPTPRIQEISKKYKVYGLPTIIFIDKNGKVLEDQTLTGFEEAPDFIKRMNATAQ